MEAIFGPAYFSFFLQRLFVHRQSLFLRFFAKIRQKEIGDKDCGQKFREEREKRKEERKRGKEKGKEGKERKKRRERKKGKERKGRKKKRKDREGKGRQEKERQGCAGFSLMLLSSIVQNRANQRPPLCYPAQTAADLRAARRLCKRLRKLSLK